MPPRGPLRTRRRLLAGLAAAAVLAPAAGVRAAVRKPARPWRLAVVPQLTAGEMYRNWSPVVDALAQAGVPCELSIHPSIARFEPEFLQGKADLVFLNPYHMVMAYRAHGYAPLLRDRRPLEGLLLVAQDSPVQSLAQLQGRRISFPAPNALAASLYIRAMLEKTLRLRYEAHYASTHSNALRQVLAGDSVAAGVVRTTFELEAPEIRQRLRVLYATPALAPHPLAAHPRLPQPVRQTVHEVFLALARDPVQAAALKGIPMPDPQPADYRRDYAPLGLLGLERFVVSS